MVAKYVFSYPKILILTIIDKEMKIFEEAYIGTAENNQMLSIPNIDSHLLLIYFIQQFY